MALFRPIVVRTAGCGNASQGAGLSIVEGKIMWPYRMGVLGLCGLLLLLQNGVSQAQNTSGGAVTVSAEDRKFILDAAQSGFHEVRMGTLGVERGTSRDLKV